jgi:hypothetical protein
MPKVLIGSDKCPRRYLGGFLKAAMGALAAMSFIFLGAWHNDGPTVAWRWWMTALSAGFSGFVETQLIVDEVHFQGGWPMEEKIK